MTSPAINLSARQRVTSNVALLRPPAVTALKAHAAALLALAAVGVMALAAGAPLPAAGGVVVTEGVIAAALGVALGLPRWWLPINVGFVPLGAGILQLGIAPHWFLAAFGILVLVYGLPLRTRVPLYLSGRAAITAVGKLLPARHGVRVADLGCGTGSMLAGLAWMRPDAALFGIEAAPLPWLVSVFRGWFAGGRFTAALGDLWHVDLARFDVVYVYLSPAPMPALWRKARREMRPGTLLISNSFSVPGVAPAAVLDPANRHNTLLYVWRM